MTNKYVQVDSKNQRSNMRFLVLPILVISMSTLSYLFLSNMSNDNIRGPGNLLETRRLDAVNIKLPSHIELNDNKGFIMSNKPNVHKNHNMDITDIKNSIATNSGYYIITYYSGSKCDRNVTFVEAYATGVCMKTSESTSASLFCSSGNDQYQP